VLEAIGCSGLWGDVLRSLNEKGTVGVIDWDGEGPLMLAKVVLLWRGEKFGDALLCCWTSSEDPA